MNCYDTPDSLGNPVLLDQQFRQAVNWAVDREKVVAVAMNGYATVGLHASSSRTPSTTGSRRPTSVHV